MNTLGYNIAYYRTKKKMSRETLADLIHVSSPRLIYDYENDKKFPSIQKLLLIANALGVTPNDLLL